MNDLHARAINNRAKVLMMMSASRAYELLHVLDYAADNGHLPAPVAEIAGVLRDELTPTDPAGEAVGRLLFLANIIAREPRGSIAFTRAAASIRAEYDNLALAIEHNVDKAA